MYIRIDPSQVPPTVELHEPAEFKAFKVVLANPLYAWVDPQTLSALAGRTADAAWLEQLRGMLAYAKKQGWVDDEGRVRAHVEFEDAQKDS